MPRSQPREQLFEDFDVQFLVEDNAFEEGFHAFRVQGEYGAFVVQYRGFFRRYVLPQEFFGVEGVVHEAAAPISPAAHYGIAAEFENGFPQQLVMVHFDACDAFERVFQLLVAFGDVELKTVGRHGGEFARRTAVIRHQQLAVGDVLDGFDFGVGKLAGVG